jgi:hypothetical protein
MRAPCRTDGAAASEEAVRLENFADILAGRE